MDNKAFYAWLWDAHGLDKATFQAKLPGDRGELREAFAALRIEAPKPSRDEQFHAWLRNVKGVSVDDFKTKFRQVAQDELENEFELAAIRDQRAEAERRAQSKRPNLTLPAYMKERSPKDQLHYVNLIELRAVGMAKDEDFVAAGFEVPA